MVRAAKRYTHEIREQTGYEATWLPIVRVAPGDVGILRGYEYRQVGTLADYAIPYEIESSHVQSTFDYVSRGAVSKSVGAAASTAGSEPTIDTKLTIQFSRADAIVFSTAGCRSSRLSRQQEIGNRVLDMYRRSLWPRDYVVVTEAITASSATILMSSSAGASLELAAQGDVKLTQIDLADASLGLRAVAESQMGISIIAQKALTPLFRASGIKRSLLGRTLFRGIAPERSARLRAADTFADRSYADFAGD